MPTPKKGPRLASSPAHERLMLANMATSLFQNGRITTTLPKAKRLRPLAERLITLAKRGDLHNPRRGDAAPAAIIELVTEPVSPKQAVVKEAEAATKVAAAEAPEAAAEEATAENAE